MTNFIWILLKKNFDETICKMRIWKESDSFLTNWKDPCFLWSFEQEPNLCSSAWLFLHAQYRQRNLRKSQSWNVKLSTVKHQVHWVAIWIVILRLLLQFPLRLFWMGLLGSSYQWIFEAFWYCTWAWILCIFFHQTFLLFFFFQTLQVCERVFGVVMKTCFFFFRRFG